MYNIKLEQFEGPFDLLLKLIDEQKMDVARVSLAQVADQYLEFISDRQNITLENLANFLSVASRLILIKSRTLLPTLDFTSEEEAEIKDLEWQLIEYKKFKDISKAIGKMYDSGTQIFSREGFTGVQSFFYPPENINAYDLKKAFLKILSEIPVIEKIEEEMVKEVITLEEKINQLEKTLKDKIESSFSEIVSQARDRVEVIVSFLAMLELVKRRMVDVEQGGLFSEIKLKQAAASNK